MCKGPEAGLCRMNSVSQGGWSRVMEGESRGGEGREVMEQATIKMNLSGTV